VLSAAAERSRCPASFRWATGVSSRSLVSQAYKEVIGSLPAAAARR
jgi:hypothetical protein